MKMSGVVKRATGLAMLALILCMLPVTAKAASANAAYGLSFNLARTGCETCGEGDVACSALNITDIVPGSGTGFSVTYEYTLGCGHSFRKTDVCSSFDCAQSYSDAAVCSGSNLRVTRAAGHSVSNWASNDDGTHSGSCRLCQKTITEDCAGGTATCAAPATCTTCNSPYGKVNSNAHTQLRYEASGNRLLETCDACHAHNESAELLNQQEDLIYKGSPWKPCEVRYSTDWKGGTPEIQYTNNTNAGTATATITVGGATARKDFEIKKRNLQDVVLSVTPASGSYTGSAHTPAVQLQHGDVVLKQNTDYSIIWNTSALTDPGTYAFEVRAMGANYQASAEGSYTIHKADPAAEHFVVTMPGSLTYDGRAKTVTVAPAAGAKNLGQVTVVYYRGDTKLTGAPSDAGAYTVKVNVASNQFYNGVENLKIADFTINPAVMDGAVVTLDKNTFTYDAMSHLPTPTVTLTGFGTLRKDVDYTVSYKKCKGSAPAQWEAVDQCVNAGNYVAVINGTGNFKSENVNSAAASFVIEKAVPTAAHFKLTLPENMVYDGAAKAVTLTPHDGITGLENTKIYFKRSANGDNEYEAKKAGTYWAGIYVQDTCENFLGSGEPIYSDDWKFTIQKADPVKTLPVAAALTYNGAEQKLITAGVANGSESIYYKLGTDGKWDTVVPTAAKAGAYTVYWYAGSETSENYTYQSGSVKAEIKPAILTVAPEPDQKMTYGKAFPELAYTVTGALTGEKPAFTGALSVQGRNAGVYEIKLGTLKLKDSDKFKAENYKIELEKEKFVIKQAYLAVTAKDQTITYGASLDKVKYTIGDTAADETATVTLTASTTGVTYDGVITPSVVVRDYMGDDVSKNYSISYTPGKLVIEPDFAVIENVTAETVKASDKNAIETLQRSLRDADVEKATTEQKKRIEDAKVTCINLLAQIDAYSRAVTTDTIKNTTDLTAENVTLADEAVIRRAMEEIGKIRTEFAGNLSAEDKTALEAQTAQLQAALDTIENVQNMIRMLGALPADIKAEDEKAAEARACFGMLSDHEKTLVEAADTRNSLHAIAYKILSDDGGIWERGKTLTFKIDGDYSRFTGILMDGKKVNAKFYTAEAGSTIVTLKKAYLKKLAPKVDHTVTFLFDDGSVEGTFHIQSTANTSFYFYGMLICFVLILVAAGGLAVVYYRKKETE